MTVQLGNIATTADVSEEERLETLRSFQPATLADDPELQRIVDFAAELCDAPVSLVSLVEEARQRFIAGHGTDLKETSRDVSFCAHAMRQADVMVVPDATADARFADNDLVTGDPHIRFYAGAPLIADDGAPLGALCVISPDPRAGGLTPLQEQGLTVLAGAVMNRLRERRREIADSWVEGEAGFQVLADAMPQIVWSTQPDGAHDYYNARWYEFTGMPHGSTDGDGWSAMFHPDDREAAWDKWQHSLVTGDPFEIEYRLRRSDGQYRWTLGRALPMRNPDGTIVRWFGTCTEIHEHKTLLESRDLLSRELGHRIKNIFSLVSGLIGLTSRRRPELKSFGAELQSRLMALAKAHELVDPRGNRSQTSLCALLAALFEPYAEEDESFIRIDCAQDAEVGTGAATPLALLFHELATNAAKYGALSVPGGRVDVAIDDEGEDVLIHWRERGGPPADEPGQRGFGSELVELSVHRQLGGTIDRQWQADGLFVTVRIPRKQL